MVLKTYLHELEASKRRASAGYRKRAALVDDVHGLLAAGPVHDLDGVAVGRLEAHPLVPIAHHDGRMGRFALRVQRKRGRCPVARVVRQVLEAEVRRGERPEGER